MPPTRRRIASASYCWNTSLLILRILLVALGAIAAGLILLFHLRDKRRDAATRNMPGGSDLDTLLRDAEHRLATAQRTGPRSLDALPLLYILGEANSAKTTAVIKSGFDPELLAGQVYRDQDVIQTPVVNIWYAHDSVFVEAGDAIRKAPALWNKLVRKTRPRAARSAMGKQAPVRAAVVCVSSELFLGAAATEAALAAGALRRRRRGARRARPARRGQRRTRRGSNRCLHRRSGGELKLCDYRAPAHPA